MNFLVVAGLSALALSGTANAQIRDLRDVTVTVVGSTGQPMRQLNTDDQTWRYIMPGEDSAPLVAPSVDKPHGEWTTTFVEAPQIYGVCDWSVMGEDVFTALYNGAPIDGYFDACEAAVRNPFESNGVALDDDAARAVFATVIAASARPYGRSTSRWLEDLYADQFLDCDNYALLAHYIYEALGGTEELWLLGWNGGALGNHAQIYYEGATRMILDPTVGIISMTDMDTVMSGGTGPGLFGVTFYWRDAWETSWMEYYIPLAHENGMPWCSLLYFGTYEQYTGRMWVGGSANWPTPGARVLDGVIAKC